VPLITLDVPIIKLLNYQISERTKDGQARARSQGKRIGRPKAATTL
jgi:hypothetical protein